MTPAEPPRPAEKNAPDPATDRVVPWVGATIAVVLIGVFSATSHAYIPFVWMVDLGVHELGHMVTGWAPWQVTAFAGSFFQVAVPFALACYFAFKRGEIWAAAPLLAWTGNSLRNVAVYIADAPYQRLPLWGGEGTLHDWAQLLQGRPMQYAGALAWFANAVGWALIAIALALATGGLVSAMGRRSARIAELRREEALPVREPHGPLGG